MTLEMEKRELTRWIQAAMGIEISTIPPYMTALISILPGRNRVAAQIIRGVMMEEMLHLSLAGNLMSAVGGRTHFGPHNIPAYPLTFKFDGQRFREREFEVDLCAFSAESIQRFTDIELPEHWHEEEFALMAVPEVTVDGYTIGEFYDKILRHLERLCAQFGEAEVFTGDPARQFNLNHYWSGGGAPIVIGTLADAKEAIELIVSQGEGSSGSVLDADSVDFHQPQDVAHFFRFREIQFGRRYQAGDDPRGMPTGEAFEVDYGATYPIWKNARQSDYADDPQMAAWNREFNAFYSLMLVQLAEAMNGAPQATYSAILNGMHGMAGVASKMVSTPVKGDVHQRHGAPSFEWVQPLSLPGRQDGSD